MAIAVSFLGACGAVTDEPDAPMARLRVAHLSPDAPPVDLCLAPAGSGAFTGPVLARAGGLAGLSYGKVTRYLDVAAGRYDVRLVAPAARDCAAALGGLPDFTDLPDLAPDATVTVAALGKVAHGGAPLTLRAFEDDPVIDPGAARLRFIHASPGTPPVELGLGGGAAFTPVFRDVAFGAAATHERGYVTTAPLDGAELSARVSGAASDALAVKPLTLPAGSLATAFAIGELGSATAPLRVLLCDDAAPPHQLETECALAGDAPERARVRLAHLSPDAPAVDVCVAPAGTGRFDAPLLAGLGARAGLAYPQVTAYVELPVGALDVRVILASETTCEHPAVPDTAGLELARGLTATVAAIGALDRSGPAIADPGFRLAVFPDATGAQPGKAKLRFVHASPGTPNVDVGVLLAHGFVRLFGNVEFGKVAVHGGIDPLGYLEATPLTAPLAARLAGAAADALVLPNVSLPADAVLTAFAIGAKTGAAAPPLRVLLCTDNAPGAGLLAACR
ncbi:MAG: DUF4397 domain-containing protein [Kofleriaceae bacterium]